MKARPGQIHTYLVRVRVWVLIVCVRCAVLLPLLCAHRANKPTKRTERTYRMNETQIHTPMQKIHKYRYIVSACVCAAAAAADWLCLPSASVYVCLPACLAGIHSVYLIFHWRQKLYVVRWTNRDRPIRRQLRAQHRAQSTEQSELTWVFSWRKFIKWTNNGWGRAPQQNSTEQPSTEQYWTEQSRTLSAQNILHTAYSSPQYKGNEDDDDDVGAQLKVQITRHFATGEWKVSHYDWFVIVLAIECHQNGPSVRSFII